MTMCLYVCLSISLTRGPSMASIARDVVVEMTLPATTVRGKFGSEFET